MMSKNANSGEPEPGTRARTSEHFEFSVGAPYADVFPLFGALREKDWAPDWDPRFVWPSPAEDRSGMVFCVDHDQKVATWINTAFDPSAGRVQYVYVLPDVVATVITLQVTALGQSTAVRVQYDRTSLTPEADHLVLAMGAQDQHAGLEWARQIQSLLARMARP